MTHESSGVYPSSRRKPRKGKFVASDLQIINENLSREATNNNQSASPGDDESSNEDEKTAIICHRAAVVRCGWMLVRTFKFLDFLPANEAKSHKCAFRNVS